MIDVSKSGFGDDAERWTALIAHSLLCFKSPLLHRHRSLPDDSAAEGKTLKGYELSGWIKVAAEPAEAEKTGEEGDFVFLYDFRNTKG